MTFDYKSLSATRPQWWWVIAGVMGLNLLVVGGFWFAGQRSVESQLAILKEKNLPTTAREVNDYYVVPAGVADTTELWVAAIDAVRLAKPQARGASLPVVGTDPAPVPAPGETWTALDAARSFVQELHTVRKTVLRAAIAGGQARFPVDFSAGVNTLLPYTQDARNVARVLMLDALVSAHDKKSEQALEDVVGIFALSDALRGEPTIISQLVRSAIHVVGCETTVQIAPHLAWNDVGLKALQMKIQGARFRDEMVLALEGERALLLSTLETLPLGPLQKASESEVLRIFERLIEANSRPWSENLECQQALIGELSAAKRSQVPGLPLAGVQKFLPSFEAAAVSVVRAEARQKCTVAIIALERFRIAHHQLPESLKELAGFIPGATDQSAAALVDPFDGKPLRYRIGEKRVLIYSVGEDEFDDDGDVEREPTEPARRPRDLGFSVPK
jgi:hypothetical protein